MIKQVHSSRSLHEIDFDYWRATEYRVTRYWKGDQTIYGADVAGQPATVKSMTCVKYTGRDAKKVCELSIALVRYGPSRFHTCSFSCETCYDLRMPGAYRKIITSHIYTHHSVRHPHAAHLRGFNHLEQGDPSMTLVYDGSK